MLDTHVAQAEESAQFLRDNLASAPSVALIAGSGLGGFVKSLQVTMEIPYSEIPHFPVPSVAGHKGSLVVARHADRDFLVLAGRKHLYEGIDPKLATLPTRVLALLGVKILIITNAAGGLNKNFTPGELMLIRDHINFTGRNPLIGPNCAEWGPRFPDLCYAYDPELGKIAHQVALKQAMILREGVYLAGHGPSYETRAEVGFLSSIGADAVGMSTVPEVLVAVHAGMRVLGFSLITNSLVHKSDVVTSHEEVMETAQRSEKTFAKFIGGLIEQLPNS
ncbi:MAG: purine-nucleoside phosphorylase [bacterium]